MSFSVKAGNFLYKNCFPVYRPVYELFKRRQDAFEISLLCYKIQKGMVVLDIGANIGFYAKIMSELVGKEGHVHCFEPDEKNFQHLKRSTAGIGNISINNAAVASQTERIKIYTSPNLNVDHRTYEPEQYDSVKEVQALSIDDYVKHRDIQKVDLIKMDIQGFEMEALKGMQDTLRKNADIVLISEFWPYGLSKAGSSVGAFFHALSESGFKCYLLKENALEQLSAETVRSMEGLPEKEYFNILVQRKDV